MIHFYAIRRTNSHNLITNFRKYGNYWKLVASTIPHICQFNQFFKFFGALGARHKPLSDQYRPAFVIRSLLALVPDEYDSLHYSHWIISSAMITTLYHFKIAWYFIFFLWHFRKYYSCRIDRLWFQLSRNFPFISCFSLHGGECSGDLEIDTPMIYTLPCKRPRQDSLWIYTNYPSYIWWDGAK